MVRCLYRLKCGKCSKKCKLASNSSSRWVAEEVGDPDLIHRLTQDIFKLKSVKLGEPPNLLANRWHSRRSRWKPPLGPPTLTRGSVKLGEVSEHLAKRREDRRARLMSLTGQKPDNFAIQRFKSCKLIHSPSLFICPNSHMHSSFYISCIFRVLLVLLCARDWITLLPSVSIFSLSTPKIGFLCPKFIYQNLYYLQ